jgi:TRAP-type C4-dicarboxylate transport system substrate-binding protein
MKKAKTLALILAAMMLFTALAGCGGSTAAPANSSAPAQSGNSGQAAAPADEGKVYELSLSTHDPVTSNKTIYLQQWADEVKEASGGRLNITVYSGGALAAGTAALDALRTGVCDIAWIYTSYFSGQFPLCEVICNPIGISSVPQATNVLYDLYDKYEPLQQEVDEFEILMFHSNPTNKISTISGKEIHSIDDLKGMTFRASAGTASDLLIAWGATPIQMAPGDIYQAVQKGTVGGYIFDWSGIVSFGLQEVTANYTTMPVYLGPYFLAMNMDSFNALPEDLQQILREHSGRDASLGMAWVYEGDEREGRRTIEAAGGNFIDVTEAEQARFEEASQALIETWITNNTKDGFDAKTYIADAEALADQYAIPTDEINSTLDDMGW